MTREIKFRLRDEHRNIVGYEKWYHGQRNGDLDIYVANPCWLYSTDGAYWNPVEVPHRFKDQSTGLHDKHGVLIYEGDIVEYMDFPDEFNNERTESREIKIPDVYIEFGDKMVNDAVIIGHK